MADGAELHAEEAVDYADDPAMDEGDPELNEMKGKLEELQEEAKKLQEMQTKAQQESGMAPSTSAEGAPKEEVDARSVYVGNVDYAATPEELQGHFARCGTVNRVTILTDRAGAPKGFAYVEFLEADAVEAACLLEGSELHGRALKVSPKRTNVPGMRARGGGRGRGRGRGGGMPYGMPGGMPYGMMMMMPPMFGYGGGGGGYAPRGGGRGRGRRGGGGGGGYAPY